MSGHSKWATIKHKKGKTDAQRGKIFTKIGRELSLAVREGGPDPSQNGKLRDIIAKAKAANLPNDNITRSIKKATGEDSGTVYEETDFEGYGMGGIAVIVRTISDNRNRTVSEVRHAFDKMGGSLGSTGCVSYLFDRVGLLIVADEGIDEDTIMMDALEAGAQDILHDGDIYQITTEVADFSAVREALQGKYTFLDAELSMLPQNLIAPQEDALANVLKMLDMLEDLDDVQEVWHNAQFPEDE